MTPESSPSADRCSGSSGCLYRGALAALHRLTGCDLTAGELAAKAGRCVREGCLAESRDGEGAAELPAPLPTPAPLELTLLPRRSAPRLARPGGGEPIAFSRSRSIDILADAQGNRVERRALRVEEVRDSASLAYLYQYWRWLRSSTPCRFRDIDPTHFLRARIIGRLHVVDVRSSDPNNFRYELLGYAVPWKASPLPREMPVPIYAETTLRDYNTVRLTGAPRLQRVRARLDGTRYHYTRLILPLLDRRSRVSHLAVAIEREPGDGTRLAPPGHSPRRED